ncbi:MAG: arylsulfotransferase family protein [Paracoccaceae bacterium]
MAIDADRLRTSLSLAFLAFLGGGAWAMLGLPPVAQVREGAEYLVVTDEDGYTGWERLSHDLGITPYRLTRRSDYRPPAGRDHRPLAIEGLYGRARPTVFVDSVARTPAYTVINAFLGREDAVHAAVLLDPAGEVAHVWPIRETLGGRAADMSMRMPHAIEVFPDGSIVTAIDMGESLSRLDACGDPIWTVRASTHHSVALDGEGAIVTWDDADIVRLDAETGRELSRLNLYDVIAANPDIDPLQVLQTDGAGRSDWLDDPLHPNDAEPLPAAMAAAFPGFEAGDLAVSFRSLNLIAVIDPETARIEWWRSGIGRRLHDPDWRPDGTIVFFDNNTNRGPSRVRRIEPATMALETLVDGADHDLYTARRGRQQMREDGAALVVSAYQGRVVEIAPDGRVVFEYLNRFDPEDGLVGVVSDALALAPDFFETPPSCAREATGG